MTAPLRPHAAGRLGPKWCKGGCCFRPVDGTLYCETCTRLNGSLGSPAMYLPPARDMVEPDIDGACDVAIAGLEALEEMLLTLTKMGGHKEAALLAQAMVLRHKLESFEPSIGFCSGCSRTSDACWDSPEGCEVGEAAHAESGELRVWNQATTEPREDP